MTCRSKYLFFSPGGPIPHNMAKTCDGPPTLERSGSEHRVGRFTAFLLRRKAWLEVDLPLERETEGFEKIAQSRAVSLFFPEGRRPR